MPRWAAKPDGNQDEVIDALRAAGWWYYSTSRLGDGFPDGLAARSGINVLVEIKNVGGRLTPKQRAFFNSCPGPKAIVYGGADAVEKLEEIATKDRVKHA